MADVAVMINNGDSYDFHSLLSSSERDFLIRNNNDQVKIDTLKGKKLGLYFSASWCGPCQRFTPILVELYDEISPKGDFEIVFVSSDVNGESFKGYFSKMPWLAIPFFDSTTRDRLDELFKVRGIPHLVILDDSGKVLCNNGVEIIREYGVEGYPFTPERIKEIKETEEAARRDQSLKSVLVSHSRDFVISSDGKKVPVSKLEGKTVGLYFSLSSFKSCVDFTAKLVDVYEKLKAKGESFEIVLISLDDEEEPFKQGFGSMPWLALPFKDKSCEKLAEYFELSNVPTLVIIGPDGKTVHSNVAEAIEEHGILAYPFTLEKFAELAEIEKAKQKAQTLESVLVSRDRDFVIGKDGAKISVSDLVGKNILLYFSAHWSRPCRDFLSKLNEAYHKIKAKDDAVEVIFISSDKDQASFNKFFSGMPWLALPFGDERKASLSRLFKVYRIPMLVALGPTGQTISKEAKDLIMIHGADAYPFTDEHLKEIEAQMAEGWPEKVKHALHEHELVLTRRTNYNCDGCNETGHVWSFYCVKCDFDLHPKCALEEDKATKNEAKGWPEKVKHALHEHELVLTRRRNYICDGCKEKGQVWSFYCEECDFDLHPKCALEEEKATKGNAKGWPEKVKHALHEHEIVLTRRMNYICDGCKEKGQVWSFYCEGCDFDLHPKCALEEKKAIKDDTKGWLEKVKHALHEHELVLTHRRNYICDGCKEKGQVWSFYCEECDFDLHPKCALEEDKATKDDAKRWPHKVKHALHEHELLLTRRKNYICDGCKEKGHVWSFYCEECDFDLHTKCALEEDKATKDDAKGWPEKVKHTLHKHELVLTSRRNYICDGCKEKGQVWSFYCEECDFDLHPKCALEEEKATKGNAKGWPEKVKHALHEHELVQTRRKNYICDGCKEMGQVWSFYCDECDFDLHPKCALEEKKTIKDDGKGWLEKVKHALHEHELVLTRRRNYICDGCKEKGLMWSFYCEECDFDLHTKCALEKEKATKSVAKGWPENVKHALHEHELVLTRQRNYICDGCKEKGQVWSFYCEECDFDLHPKCALEEKKAIKDDTKGWLEKVKHALHEHELVLTHRRNYICDGCKEKGQVWSFYCEECDFDLHPKCALEEDKATKDDAKGWPHKVKHALHEHELLLTRRKNYICDGCKEKGQVWSFYCEKCDFDLHPKCALDGVPSATPYIVIIAGENKGAFMEVLQFPKKHGFGGNPHHPHMKGYRRINDGREWNCHSNSSGEEGSSKMKDKSHNAKAMPSFPMSAFMNRNVQGANNSIVCNSSCTQLDPGVHVVL